MKLSSKIKPLKKNKKGQVDSVILAIVLIFIIAIIFLFYHRVTDELYGHLDEYFNSTADYNDSAARTTLQDIRDTNNSVWDYVVLAVVIGVLIQMTLLSFATRINVAFYWLFVIIGIVIFVLGIVLSNIWMNLAENAEFSTSIDNFPITNMLLGSYGPTLVLGMLFIILIVLFGKPPREEG